MEYVEFVLQNFADSQTIIGSFIVPFFLPFYSPLFGLFVVPGVFHRGFFPLFNYDM
jgi:hypothetical protein